MDRRDMLLTSGALAMASLAGCVGDGGLTERAESGDDLLPMGEPAAVDERTAAAATDIAEFALELHTELADSHDNLFFSPYTLSSALAMTYAGATGETQAQMEAVLYDRLGSDVHPAFDALATTLESREMATDSDGSELEGFELSVGNALWGQEGVPFADDYLDLLETYYDAGLREAEFDTDAAGERERINDWVAGRTNDRIENLLPDGTPSSQTVLLLTTATAFAASWYHEFDPEDTTEGPFTALDGTESTVPFMAQNIRADYATVPNAAIVELPYVGEEVSMVLILPDDGAFESFEQSLDAETLFGIFDDLGDAGGTLALPKFTFRTTAQLSEVLPGLGLDRAFSGGFDGMIEGDDGTDLFVSEVVHEAFVTVDEEGTEAATAATVEMQIDEPEDWGELRFDRPFLFCIRDRPTDTVLFFGRVTDAGSAQNG